MREHMCMIACWLVYGIAGLISFGCALHFWPKTHEILQLLVALFLCGSLSHLVRHQLRRDFFVHDFVLCFLFKLTDALWSLLNFWLSENEKRRRAFAPKRVRFVLRTGYHTHTLWQQVLQLVGRTDCYNICICYWNLRTMLTATNARSMVLFSSGRAVPFWFYFVFISFVHHQPPVCDIFQIGIG